MSSKRRNIEELIRYKEMLGTKLAKVDPEYAFFAGAEYLDGQKMAMINFLIETDQAPAKYDAWLRLYWEYLDQKRKAYFMTLGSDIMTKLAVLTGQRDKPLDASARTIPNTP